MVPAIVPTVPVDLSRTKANATPVLVTLTSGSIEIGTVDQGFGGASPWLINGTVAVSNFPLASASNGSTTAVTVSTSSAILLTTNASRKGYTIFNTVGTLYILLGSGSASLVHFTMRTGQYGFISGDSYIGPISAVRASGSGDVYITELV